MQECQHLSRQICEVGMYQEARPGVRFVKRQQIENYQATNPINVNSSTTLEESARNGQIRILEKIDENPSQQRTFPSNESLENSYDDRSSKFHGRTQSNIQTRLTPIGSPLGSKVTFESIERLKAFKSKAFNKVCRAFPFVICVRRCYY